MELYKYSSSLVYNQNTTDRNSSSLNKCPCCGKRLKCSPNVEDVNPINYFGKDFIGVFKKGNPNG